MSVLVAAALLALAAPGAGSAAKEVSTLLADLPPDVARSVGQGKVPGETPFDTLERVFSAATPYHFDAGLVGVDTDRRWFQTVPPEGPGAPVLEVRRWPGDTVLAFYDLEGAAPSEPAPKLSGATFSPRSGSEAEGWRWDGMLESAMGTRTFAWLEFRVPEVPRRLGALLVPGDAGLGGAATRDLAVELLSAAGRIELRPEAWESQQGTPAGTALTPPTLDPAPSDADERRDTWQVMDAGGFTLGLPPGVRARRLDEGVEAPRPVPSAVLWLRGRFVDRKGERVAIGDGERAGYVAVVPSLSRAWSTGVQAPLGAKGAKKLAGEDFTIACEQTGAVAAEAERWSEPGFTGEWLVFRLLSKGSGLEIGLPIVSGRQSEALFWIPTTLRGAGVPPAAPPVDPADRFGISYKQFSKLEQANHPGLGGSLVVPGMRVELPTGWSPITTLRSANGFPIQIVDASGKSMGRLVRVEAGAPQLAEPETAGWIPASKRGSRKSAAVYRRQDGARLFVSADGSAIQIEPDAQAAPGPHWLRFLDSAAPLRAGPAKVAGGDGR